MNHKHAFLCREMYSSHTAKKKKRQIDRGDETAFSGGVGSKRGERKGGSSGVKGCLAGQSVKEGRQNAGLSPERKKRQGLHKMMD